MAVLADDGASSEDCAHVDHGALAYDGADVDDRTHHDDGIVTDGDLFADDGTRLDSRVHPTDVEQRNAGVASVALYDDVLDVAGVLPEGGLDLRPVAKDDLASRSEDVGVRAVVDLRPLTLANEDAHGRLLGGTCYVVDDFLSVHWTSLVVLGR